MDSRTLAKIAQAIDIDLHWLITGKLSPSVALMRKALKPFALAHLNDVLTQIQDLEKERQALLANPARGEIHALRLDEIQEEMEDRHLYYKAVLEHLDEALEPLELKAKLSYNLIPIEVNPPENTGKDPLKKRMKNLVL